MMLDSITFDLGGASMPTFVFSDVSGLAPLTLPDEFLHGQNQQQPAPQSDTVRRFETAMSVGPQISPSVVESVMACMISGSPKVETPKTETPVAADKPIGVSVEQSVSVAVEKPVVASVSETIPEGPMARPADERPVVVPDLTSAPVIVAPVEATIVVEKTSAKPAEKPIVASVEMPTVIPTEKPVVASVEKPVVVSAEKAVVLPAEKPTVVAPSPAPTVVPIVLENPPVAADKPIGVSVEAVAKTVTEMVGTAPRAVRGGRGATALPGFAIASIDSFRRIPSAWFWSSCSIAYLTFRPVLRTL